MVVYYITQGSDKSTMVEMQPQHVKYPDFCRTLKKQMVCHVICLYKDKT